MCLLTTRKSLAHITLLPTKSLLTYHHSGLVKGVAQAPNISASDMAIMFDTNVTGLINMTQAILPVFQSRNPPSGDIINIGSIAGREPYQGGSIYCASKAAVRSFTDSLRRELIATRIRVMELDPGQVETEFSVVRFGGDKEKAKKVYEGVEPLTGEDIAEVVVFATGRRENVVLADSLIFPNHQVSISVIHRVWRLIRNRQRQPSCIENLLANSFTKSFFDSHKRTRNMLKQLIHVATFRDNFAPGSSNLSSAQHPIPTFSDAVGVMYHEFDLEWCRLMLMLYDTCSPVC